MAERGQAGGVRAWIHFWHDVVGVDPHLFAYLVATAETLVALGLVLGAFSNVTNLIGGLLAFVIWPTAEGFGGPCTVDAMARSSPEPASRPAHDLFTGPSSGCRIPHTMARGGWRPSDRRGTNRTEGQANGAKARRVAEQQRRQALRRRATRRRRAIRALGAAVAALVVVGAGLLVLESRAAPQQRARAETALLSGTAVAARAAGCGPVRDVGSYQPTGEDRAHVTALPPLSSYPSRPPASGPHFAAPLGGGVYASPPSLGEAIHSLEHGAVDIWVSPSLSPAALRPLVAAFAGADHVLIAPYDYPGPGGTLPAGARVALVAWQHVQFCARPSIAVARAFVGAYRYEGADPGAYRGDAPELGAPI